MQDLGLGLSYSLYAACAAFKFIGAALGATPTQLGQITLSRALVQAASSPMAGLLGDRLDRVHLVATGCLLWAACTAAIGMSTTLTQVCCCPRQAEAAHPLTGLPEIKLAPACLIWDARVDAIGMIS